MCTSSEPSIKGIIGIGLEAPLHAGSAASSSILTTSIDNGPLLNAIEQNFECVINGQRMTVHSYLLTAMADALAEVGVAVGELDNMPKISIIEGKGVVERGAWADQVDSGVLIVAGASCPHGVIVYWACGPAKGLLAWCLTLKPSMGAAEILGLQFGDRVFIWGTDPVEPADFFKKFKLVQKASKVATPKQMALGILLVHLHSCGGTWDGFTPLSKRGGFFGSLLEHTPLQPSFLSRTFHRLPPPPLPPSPLASLLHAAN